MGNASQARLEALRAAVGEVEPSQAHADQGAGALLIDVREPDEVRGGLPVGAVHLRRGFLELKIEEAEPDKQRAIHVICAGGARSLFAAQGLLELGYENVRSVKGGFSAWKTAGLPIEVPDLLDDSGRERYARHLLLPEVGEAGQLKLKAAKVALLGAGGLGSPAAFYLAAAGVGELRLIDDDVVDRSNLQRQILHTDARVGRPKVESAAQTLSALNPDVRIDARQERLNAGNVEELLGGVDVVVDGADNFSARYLVNDACVQLGLPNVHGSIYRFEGQVSVFAPHAGAPCYRCLYPEAPPPELAPSCAEAGVLGVLPGVVGCLQAVEALKWILDLGRPLTGRLLHYDALRQEFRELQVPRDPNCARCGEGAVHTGYEDIGEVCSA